METKNIVIAVAVVALLASGGWFLLGRGKAPESVTKVSGKVRVGGSGTAMSTVKVLASAFETKYPGAKLEFAASTDSGDGIKGTYSGVYNLGTVSRKPKDEELSTTPVSYWPLAGSTLGFVVHSGVSVTGLSSQQIRDIYSGKVSNWSEVGGSNLPIKVLARDEDESSTKIFRKAGAVFGPDFTFRSDAEIMFTTPKMNEAIANTPGAIGYGSLGAITSQRVSFKPLALDGVALTSGAFPYKEEMGLVTKEEKPTGVVGAFLDFIGSTEAQSLMKQNGWLTL